MAPGKLGTTLRHIQNLIDSKSAADLTDADLVRRFGHHRDEVAFTILVRRHGGLVLKVCRHVLHHEMDAEDAFQATFLILARKGSAIRKRTSIACWLHGVAFRTAMNFRKSAMRRHKHETTAAEGRSQESPVSEAGLKELQSLLDEELQHLSECYRAPFVLCCLEGKSRAEAAQELGWNEGTLSTRLAKARKMLQNRLTARGVTLAAALCATALSQSATSAAVPVSLTTGTIKAALAFAAGKAAGAVSAPVIALAEGVSQGMLITKLKTGAAMVLVVLLGVCAAGALIAHQESAAKQAKKAAEPNPPIKVAGDQAEQKNDKQALTDRYGDTLPQGAVARLGTQRFRHGGDAVALVFTPDGKTLIGKTHSGLLLWDAATGKERYRLPLSNPDRFSGMGLSPDGTALAISESAVDGETKVSLLELPSGKKIRTLSIPHEDLRTRPCFAPNGKSVAFCNLQSNVDVFDLTSGKVLASLKSTGSRFYTFAFSPDSKILAVAIYPEPGNPNGVYPNHSVQLWDIVTGKFIRAIYDLPAPGVKSYVRAIAFAPNGKMLAFGILDRIFLFDPATGKELGQLEAKMGQVTALAFTPDGKKLVSSGTDRKVCVWNVATGTISVDLRMSEGSCSMALSPDGKTVALDIECTVQLWDVDMGKERLTEHQGHYAPIISLAFSPDGKKLVSTGKYGQIFLWDTASRQRCGILPGSARTLSFSPDGKHLATIAAKGQDFTTKVRIWNVVAGEEASVITVPDTGDVTSATFSPDGRKLFTLDWNQTKNCIRHWDVASGKQDHLWIIPPHESWLPDLAPDGKTVLRTRPDGVLSIYDVQSGRKRVFHGREGGGSALTLSPDARVLASGRWAQNPAADAQLWEVVTGKEIFPLKGHQGAVANIAWSSDGRLVATGDGRTKRFPAVVQSVRLWDSATGKELARFGGFNTDVTALSFSPDGKSLVAGLRDTTILIWEVGKADPKSRPALRLGKDELESRWTDLAGDNAGQAHRAIGALVAAPRQSVPFLKGRLKPTQVADAGKIQQWIADLNSETFAVRQAAAKELALVGEQVETPIRKALKGNVSLETRRRLEQVLDTLSDVPDPGTVRTVRAIMVLERIGSPESQAVLEALAPGAPEARLTREAKGALQRLSQRTGQ